MVGDHGVVVWLDVPGWMGAFTSRACPLPTAANPEAANIELRTTAKPKLVIGFIAELLLFKRKVMATDMPAYEAAASFRYGVSVPCRAGKQSHRF